MNIIYLGTLCFLTGCCWQLQHSIAAAAFTIFILLFVIIRSCIMLYKRQPGIYECVVLLFFLLLGVFSGWRLPEAPAQQLLPAFGKQAEVVGRVDVLSVKQYAYGTSLIINCQQLKINAQDIPYTGKLRVFTGSSLQHNSGVVYCRGELLPLQALRNPGGFDAERWNRLHGLGGRLHKAQVTFISSEPALSDKLAVWNLKLRQQIAAAGGKQAAVLSGMLLGGSDGLDESTRKAFSDNGLAHLLSVSGSHLVLLTGFLLLLLQKLKRGLRLGLIGSALLLYAGICGWQAPVIRALIMSLILLYGGSGAAKGHILCMAAVVMLIFKPLWLLDAGFQLSFSAAAGLIWLFPVLRARLSSWLPLWLAEGVAVTLAAQLLAVPLLVSYFHQLSLISLLSNIVLVPVLEFALLLTAAGLLVSQLCGAGAVFLKAAGFLVQQLLLQAKLLASIPGSTAVIGSLPFWCGIVYYFLLFILLDLPCVQFLQNKERRVLIVTLLLALGGGLLWNRWAKQPFTAYFLDVGQGDCAVLFTPQGKTVVIDTGGLKDYDTGSRVIAPFLRSAGKSKIDMLLLSHGDFDHVGGAVSLAENMAVQKVLVPKSINENLMRQLTEVNSSCQIIYPAAQQLYCVDNYVNLRILSAESSLSVNDGSLVAAVESGKHKLLFTGDISQRQEEKLLLSGPYEVLKVAHHGSKNSSSLEFLQHVQPSLALVSAGSGNSYGHPHQETLQRLHSVGSFILRTDQLGAVKIVFDDAETKCYSYVYHQQYF